MLYCLNSAESIFANLQLQLLGSAALWDWLSIFLFVCFSLCQFLSLLWAFTFFWHVGCKIFGLSCNVLSAWSILKWYPFSFCLFYNRCSFTSAVCFLYAFHCKCSYLALCILNILKYISDALRYVDKALHWRNSWCEHQKLAKSFQSYCVVRGWSRALILAQVEFAKAEGQPKVSSWLALWGKTFKIVNSYAGQIVPTFLS